MPWRSLLRYLSNNEELIRRLSESYPIRRAAQITAYFLNVTKDKFIDHKGKYDRAGGWDKTKRDLKDDFKGVQDIGKEYISNIFRPYTDTWEKYKESRRTEEKPKTSSSSSSSSTSATTRNNTKTTGKRP